MVPQKVADRKNHMHPAVDLAQGFLQLSGVGCEVTNPEQMDRSPGPTAMITKQQNEPCFWSQKKKKRQRTDPGYSRSSCGDVFALAVVHYSRL